MLIYITICIFAFKAEAKQKYGCYKKSQIDIISESELCKIIVDGDMCRIKELLTEKMHMGDSVIEVEWFEKFSRAVTIMYKGDNASEVKKQIENVSASLIALKEKREENSDYFLTQPTENYFVDSLELLSSMFGETKNE